jgi:phosphoglucomutase
MKVSPFAGKPAEPSMLVNVPKLITAYYTETPDPSIPEQRISFGTSGHRGSAFQKAFNEWHILAISQAICLYRGQQKIDGPLFLGMDTHALSVPALASALEVLAANRVDVMIAEKDEYTPTPVVSHTILTYNRGRKTGLADGVVITPSHNPPHDGGFKYNPPNGGPAERTVTDWIEAKANTFLESGLRGVKRIPFEKALSASTTHRHDYLNAYISDLGSVIDMDAIHGAKINLGVDPLGGAGVHYWKPIGERYGLNLTVVNEAVDPTFRFMTVDWDGQIRMDPSSPYAMQRLINLKDRFEIAFAGEIYHELTREFGEPVYDRVEASATLEQKEILARLSPKDVRVTELAGERIVRMVTSAPGNKAPIGRLKVIAENGWFAARPSGTEEIYKIYAESFKGQEHLQRIISEAQEIVNDTFVRLGKE